MSNLTNLTTSNEEEILTEVVEGSLKSLESEEIEANTLYSVKDFPIGGITNKQMADALTEDQAGFYQKNSVYLCLDNGTYTKNKFYRFTNYAWAECEVGKEYTAGQGISIANNAINVIPGTHLKVDSDNKLDIKQTASLTLIRNEDPSGSNLVLGVKGKNTAGTDVSKANLGIDANNKPYLVLADSLEAEVSKETSIWMGFRSSGEQPYLRFAGKEGDALGGKKELQMGVVTPGITEIYLLPTKASGGTHTIATLDDCGATIRRL